MGIDDDILEKGYEAFHNDFWKIICLLKNRGVVVDEAFTRELCQASIKVYNTGFEAGVNEGICQYENKVVDILTNKIMRRE